MPDAAYRLYLGDRSATREELERVEEITVEQEMDMVWEARIRVFLRLDETGRWRQRADEAARQFSRVRVELRVGDRPFVPLIDGPVAAYDTALDSQPGQSSATLVVRDDSVFLNREEDTEVFENRADDAIAREVFGRFSQIGDTRVQSAGAAQPVTVRRATAIQFLRELARVHAFHAYVLPGAQPGRSVGCFLPDPPVAGAFPPLVLLGSDRNLSDLEVREESEDPERTRGRTLRFADQQVVSSERSAAELDLMRPLPAVPDDLTALRELPPEDNDRDDPEERVRGQARRRSYAYRVTGKVVPGCYKGVLLPYQRVSVQAGDLPLSGAWLLTKVTHRITPSLYTQEFEARADSREDPAGADAGAGGGALGLSLSFSASLSVF